MITELTRLKISLALKGRPHTPEQRHAMRLAKLGTKRPQAVKDKIGEGVRRYHANRKRIEAGPDYE